MYMATTSISAESTATEIIRILVAAGAISINQVYDKESKKIIGLGFMLCINELHVPFSLPARTDPIFTLLQQQRSPKNRDKMQAQDRQQAERVAWRQLLRWIQAQLAMIETGMVKMEEVFMPYMQNEDGRTIFEIVTEKRFNLPAIGMDQNKP